MTAMNATLIRDAQDLGLPTIHQLKAMRDFEVINARLRGRATRDDLVVAVCSLRQIRLIGESRGLDMIATFERLRGRRPIVTPKRVRVIPSRQAQPKPAPIRSVVPKVPSIAEYAPVRTAPGCLLDDRPFALVSEPKGGKKMKSERRHDLPGQTWMF